MTCTLILTRHAKSDWNAGAPSDHARPLNERGRRSAPALGAWLRDIGHLPQQVICSSARRTRETWGLMGLDAPAVYTERLYAASADIIFKVLSEARHPRIMILGHNPGLATFAHAILKTPPDHARFDDFPTGATLVAEFDLGNWGGLAWRSGRALDFTVPRELLGG